MDIFCVILGHAEKETFHFLNFCEFIVLCKVFIEYDILDRRL